METIAAIATAQSPSAIGIVRLSGEGTRRVLTALFTPASGAAVEDLPYRRMTYGDIRSADGTLVLGYGSLSDEACASVGETLKKLCTAAREASVTV